MHRQPHPPATSLDPADLPSIPPDIRLAQLENGLVIIVREDHSAPVVSAQAWCRSGSIHEGEWLGAGMSHALEHMLFKGTTTRGAGRIDQEIQDAGGYMNAYTSFDRTVYWINVPHTGARVAIDVLCDIMQHATLPGDELEKEKQVILREMDMTRDDPARRSGRRLFETAYTVSPYRYTVIGYPDIFHLLSRESLLRYYQTHYSPNNVFHVVVGDIRADEVIEQIAAAHGSAPMKSLPPLFIPDEPAHLGSREIIEEAPVELGHLHLGWHIPALRHPDVPALDVLATLLGSGRSSRLYREVRDRQALVHSVSAWTYSPGLTGLFGASAVADGSRFDDVRAALLAEVRRMKDQPVPPAELAKAVKQFVSATLATRKTMQGQAQDLGANWIAASDLNFSERYLTAVKSLGPADLQRVACQYLTEPNRTLYALLPKGARHIPSINVATQAERPVVLFELPNGLHLLVKENHRLPFVDFRAVLKGGMLGESPRNNGITLLMSHLLLKGTRHRSADRIADEIESLGGSIDSFGGNHSFGVSAEVMAEDFPRGLELVADVLLNPAFPPGEFERERNVQLAGIRARRDQVLQTGFAAMRRALFGPVAYGLENIGTIDSVTALTLRDLPEHHHRLAHPRNCVLAIFGAVDAEAVRSAVEQTFGGWEKRPTAMDQLPGIPDLPVSSRVTEFLDKKQAVVVAGYRGTRLQQDDRYALDLLQEACSDLGSRLFLRVREELGLAYYVGAQHFPGLLPGYFAFYAGTAPEKAALVEQEILRESSLLAKEGLSDVELNRAKAKWLGDRMISRQDLGHLALTTALDELNGLGYQHVDREDQIVRNLTADQVRAAAARYLTPERQVIAIVQPDTGARAFSTTPVRE